MGLNFDSDLVPGGWVQSVLELAHSFVTFE